jgi:uncharacterized protein YndB with AHSA1/START domain
MPDIWYRIGFEATPADVYNSFAGVDGITTWWTPDVEGESAVGRTLAFCFGRPEPSAVMEVVELTPAQRVQWRCVQGPDEWLGTTVTFDLTDLDGETVLQFKHAGWKEQVEFMAHCSAAWASYLLGLKAELEGGKANPWPGGTVSRWG